MHLRIRIYAFTVCVCTFKVSVSRSLSDYLDDLEVEEDASQDTDVEDGDPGALKFR